MLSSESSSELKPTLFSLSTIISAQYPMLKIWESESAHQRLIQPFNFLRLPFPYSSLLAEPLRRLTKATIMR